MLQKIKEFLDQIFAPPISFLELARERLVSANSIVSRGINFRQYLSIFGDLPASWQMVISSILTATVVLISLVIFRAVMRMYYATKEGVKWW